eukprot:TRINITY_DN17447_c0_g2_i1.p1 TRINITY_DN17447_c0_g2~~TRINITY_DN17447_c0_g2_i1.p1  ORF type:complete len:864 (+),score=168.17 TRINITY_DN17447_c0_g2_i1:95-2686(+)
MGKLAVETPKSNPLTPRVKTTGKEEASDSGIKVLVRIRPFNRKEIETSEEEGSAPQPVVEVENQHTTVVLLDHTMGYCDKQPFQFDYCYTSFKPRSITFDSDSDDDGPVSGSQDEVYERTGLPALKNAWEGYNACVFAYGQTSSGKTYTMMGSKTEPGVIPRLCRSLFEKIEEIKEQQNEGKKKTVKVQVSFMEIYNEKVKDLLRPPDKGPKVFQSRFDERPIGDEYQNLRVRNHPLHGPFVEGITKKDVGTWGQCVEVIRNGNSARACTSTQMNDTSSRSHAIFQLWITQTEYLGAKMKGQPITSNRTAKLNLVDLAGSERTGKTDVTGKQLQEANYINKSLMTLRKVIDTLVGNTTSGGSKLPPYRESLLTWVLSDNFGGNAKTVMIANVSPYFQNASETESTLRYATTAKGVVNRVKVNEDASAKLIRELQAQVKELHDAKVSAQNSSSGTRIKELEDEIALSNKAIEELRDREQDLQAITERYKVREKELLEEQARLKERADRLEAESSALRAELEESRRRPQSVAEEAVRQSKDSGKEKEEKTGLRHTKFSKAHFWLDEDTISSTGSTGRKVTTPPHPDDNKKKKRESKDKEPRDKDREGRRKKKEAAVVPPPQSDEAQAPTSQPKAGRRAREAVSAPPPRRAHTPEKGDSKEATKGKSDAQNGSSGVSTSQTVTETSKSASPVHNSEEPIDALSTVKRQRKRGQPTDRLTNSASAASTSNPSYSLTSTTAPNSALLKSPGKSRSDPFISPNVAPRDALDDMMSPTTSTKSAIQFTEVKGNGNKDKFDSLFQPSTLTSLLRKKQGAGSPTRSDGVSPKQRQTPPARQPHRPTGGGPSTAPHNSQRVDALDDMRRQLGS